MGSVARISIGLLLAMEIGLAFQRFIDTVPTEFKQLAQVQAPYRIINPGPGGFDAGGQYANYYSAYIDQIWQSNGLTIPKPGPNASGLAADPDLSAAIYRHTAGPGTFAPDGKPLSQSMWSSSANFYQAAPANCYSSYISHSNPQYMLVAIGW